MTTTLPNAPVEMARPWRERAAREAAPALSVIVIVSERPEPLRELYEEFAQPLRADALAFEFVFVAPPYNASLLAPLEPLAERGEPVRVVVAGRNVGETGLLRMGLEACAGRIVATLPAYRQVASGALAELVRQVEEGADLAVARRWPRRDALVNRIQNRALHLALGRLTGDHVHDVACGVRAMRRQVLEELPLYGDFVRFLPLLALHNGFSVREVPAPQHAHDMRGRLYGPGVYLRRLIDLLGLFFLLRFTDKPLRFFGLLGSVLGLAGAIVLGVLLVQRLLGEGVADRPARVLGVLLVTLGVQAVALGLIGEMIVHFNAPGRRRYRVAEPGTSGDGA